MAKLDKQRVKDLSESYKALISLSMLAVKENDLKAVLSLNESINRIFNKIKPELTADELDILSVYGKLLALEYSNLKPKTANAKLKVIKLQLDFDYDEDMHAIALAQLFCQEKKYKEAIMLADYLTTVCESAPPYLVLAQSYRGLKMYDMSIKSYNTYLVLNENDKDAEKELDEVYEEMLG